MQLSSIVSLALDSSRREMVQVAEGQRASSRRLLPRWRQRGQQAKRQGRGSAHPATIANAEL